VTNVFYQKIHSFIKTKTLPYHWVDNV
jgi:hypothetical protein